MNWVDNSLDQQIFSYPTELCWWQWHRFQMGIWFYKLQEELIVQWIVALTSIIDDASSSPTSGREVVFWLSSDRHTQVSDGFERITSHQRPGGLVDSGMDFWSYCCWFKPNYGEQLLFWVQSEAIVSGLTMSEPE